MRLGFLVRLVLDVDGANDEDNSILSTLYVIEGDISGTTFGDEEDEEDVAARADAVADGVDLQRRFSVFAIDLI